MSLLGEMRRRNILKISLAYAIFAFLSVRIVEAVVTIFDAPEWIVQALVLLLILLFPVIVLLSWAYELKPDNVESTNKVGYYKWQPD